MNKRWAWVALLAACVPAAEEPDPRGGVVARLVPSASTAGQPFTSSDGWTVTVEKFAMRGSLTALRGAGDGAIFGGGYGPPSIITPNDACELRVTAVSVGPALASVDLQSRYPGSEDEKESICGVDPALLTYFDRDADNIFESSSEPKYVFHRPPNLLLFARAEKNGRSFRLQLALDTSSFGGSEVGVRITIEANKGVPVRIGVDAAALFFKAAAGSNGPTSIDVPFEKVAAADKDGDGIVTGVELKDTAVLCRDLYGDVDNDFASSDEECGSLVETLNTNATNLIGPAP